MILCHSNSNGEYVKVYQKWYEYPDRCDPNLYDENNPDNIRHLLHDPFADIEELKKYSATAATYFLKLDLMLQVRQNSVRRSIVSF